MARALFVILLAALALAAPAHAQATLPSDCAWPVRSNADRGNVAYPDESAQYWVSAFAGAPGTHLEIHGQFPHARYMSVHAYEGSIPVDKLTDFELRPESGVNPFVPGADRTRPGSYPLRVVAEAPPAARPAPPPPRGRPPPPRRAEGPRAEHALCRARGERRAAAGRDDYLSR